MDQAVWLADDGQYPAPLGQVTTQHQREVLQLWLVKEPADELVEDTQEEYTEPQAKKARHAHDTLTLLFANVTNFGAKVQDWTWTKGDAFLFLHETHMAEAATTRALPPWQLR